MGNYFYNAYAWKITPKYLMSCNIFTRVHYVGKIFYKEIPYDFTIHITISFPSQSVQWCIHQGFRCWDFCATYTTMWKTFFRYAQHNASGGKGMGKSMSHQVSATKWFCLSSYENCVVWKNIVKKSNIAYWICIWYAAYNTRSSFGFPIKEKHRHD